VPKIAESEKQTLPLMNADDNDQEEIGTSGNRKGKSSPRRRGENRDRKKSKNSPLIDTDDTGHEEIAKIADIGSERFFSVPPRLRGEDLVPRIQQLASK